VELWGISKLNGRKTNFSGVEVCSPKKKGEKGGEADGTWWNSKPRTGGGIKGPISAWKIPTLLMSLREEMRLV